MPEREYQIGRFTLQLHRQLVGPDGPADLGRKAIELLSVLATADGAVVTKDELMAEVWPGVIVEENSIQAQIVVLRKTLGEDAKCLSTVRGLGYRLNRESIAPPATIAVPNSVAVLPFANLTGDPALDYLGEGMAEELINSLCRAPDLKVPSRTSSFAYRSRDIDVRAIARDLGVGTVLEGSVRTDGQRLRVTAQLIEASTGFHLWSEKYDRPFDNLLALQDDLAEAICAALKTRLGSGRPTTQNVRAFQLYQQARAVSLQMSASGMLNAIQLHEEAIALDPFFAKAWAGLSGALLVASNIGALPLEARTQARAHAEHALALDPALTETHAILGTLDSSSGHWLEAEGRFAVACSGTPDPVIFESMATSLLMPLGCLERAERLALQAFDLSPARASPSLVLAHVAALKGENGKALEYLEKAIMLGLPESRPSVGLLRAELSRAKGNFAETATHFSAALPALFNVPGSKDVCRQIFEAISGCGARAVAIDALDGLFRQGNPLDTIQRAPLVPGIVMQFFVELGAIDQAFAVAEMVVELWRSSGRLAIASLGHLWLPGMLELRRDPRFNGLVTQLGMIPFWAEHGAPDNCTLRHGTLIVQ